MTPKRHNNKRHGVGLVYAIVVMVAMCAICSFAVDYGSVQFAKSQLQGAADAAALAGAAVLRSGSKAVRNEVVRYAAANLPGTTDPIDAARDIIFGYWGDPQDLVDGPDDLDSEDDFVFDEADDDVEDPDVTPVFTALTAGDGRINAVKVDLSRTAERGNAPALVFAAALGAKSCDVHVSAIAVGYTLYPGDGFVGIKKLKMSKRSFTDSYKSDWGSYSAYPPRERGSVKTNGKLKFKKDVTIHGDAHPGVHRKPATGGTVTGSRSPLTYMLSYAPVEALPKKKPHPEPKHQGNFKVEEHTTYTLTEGTYRFKDFKIEKGATLNLVGEVTLILDGKFEMKGDVNTYQNKPANFRIRVAGKKGIKIGKGDRSLYADIYAPRSKAKIDKLADLYGALIAKEFKVGDGAALHYDESLYAKSAGTSLVK